MSFYREIAECKRDFGKNKQLSEIALPVSPKQVLGSDWLRNNSNGCLSLAKKFPCQSRDMQNLFSCNVIDYICSNCRIPVSLHIVGNDVSVVVGDDSSIATGLESEIAQSIEEIYADLYSTYSTVDKYPIDGDYYEY